MNEITDFLNRFTSEYDLNHITKEKALYIENNISKGGRVANFIVDETDIEYYKDILFNILFKNFSSIKINNITDLMKYINIIAEWIQLRLNTRFLFLNKDWDYFNERYIKMCFGFTNFHDMKINPYELQTLLHRPGMIAKDIAEIPRLLGHFQDYLKQNIKLKRANLK